MYKPKKNKKVFTDPIIQFESKELEPERELYVAVIKRAILDLANTEIKHYIIGQRLGSFVV